MTIEKKLLGTNPVSGEVLPEAVSFDRANDYLYRSSDLTGNSDGKTFTFSCWFYGATGGTIYHSGGAGYTDGVSIGFEQSGELNIKMDNPSGSTVFSVEHGGAIAMNTWNHLLISCNMSSTSNRHIYVNDVALGNNYLTYTNSDIDFTSSTHSIVQLNKLKGRLAHLFLDYTYRNLSTTSNRRLFIDADGKPSSTIPSSPILYLPMTDAATAGSNSGTGGDFTVNGVLATAERGPNQDNCSASTFDGSNDYLTRSSITGLSDSKLFTFSFNASQTTGHGQIFTSSNGQVSIKLESRQCTVRLGNSGGAVLYFSSPATAASKLYYGQHNHWCFSCDLSDTNKRHMFLNGVDITSGINFIHYVNAVADLTHTPNAIGAGATGSDKFNGSIGEFYLDTAYYDLATENPFWDSDTNLPNSVRKVISDTSVTPAIAMPLIGSDAGNNLGSGGDFTVNSGPYVGARGGSEFFARSVDFNGSTGYLSKSSALTGATDSDAVTIAFAINPSAIGDDGIFGFGNYRQYLYRSSSGTGLQWVIRDSSGNNILSTTSFSIADYTGVGTWDIYLMSCDLSAFQAKVYKNGVATGTFTLPSSNAPSYAAQGFALGGMDPASAGDVIDAEFGGFYFATSYTDFAQEANRNKFVDQLGYLKDLTPAIEAGDIPTPLVYMKFDPTVSLGTNSGTGGNLTVNGGVVAGADVKS